MAKSAPGFPSRDPSDVFEQNGSEKDAYGFYRTLTHQQRAICTECEAKARERAHKYWEHERRERTLRTQPGTRDLKRRCRKGIPFDLRPWIWMEISGASQRRAGHTPTYFHDTSLIEVKAEHVAQIDLDIVRTFPEHPTFRDPDGQRRLRMVLLTYAAHNPRVGYCQGMNYVAAILLLVLNKDPERAFWVLESLIGSKLLADTYDHGISGCITGVYVLTLLVQSKLPKLWQHLERYQIDLLAVVAQWYLSLFTQDLPCETAVRIFDALLLEGSKVLHRVGIALMTQFQPALLKARGSVEFSQELKSCCSVMFDRDMLMRCAFKEVGSMPAATINKYANQAKKQS